MNPPYNTYTKGNSPTTFTVTVVRSLNDIARVIAIRAAVFITEQHCPYDEEFDGNDLCALHLIGYRGDEPIACLRARFFADFCKLERLAVLKKFRKSRMAFQIVRAGIELARKKGYRKIYGHGESHLANFWSRFGTRLPDRNLSFSGYDFIEFLLDTDPHPDPITLDTDPYVIIRPEGVWHLKGPLEAKEP